MCSKDDKKRSNNLSLDFINYTEAVEEKFLKTWKIVVVQTLLTIVIASGRTVIVEVCKYRNRTFKLLQCTGASQLTMKFKFTTPTFFCRTIEFRNYNDASKM